MSFCCLLLWFSEFFYPVLSYRRRDLGSILGLGVRVMLPAWMQLVLFDRVGLFGLREFVLRERSFGTVY